MIYSGLPMGYTAGAARGPSLAEIDQECMMTATSPRPIHESALLVIDVQSPFRP